MKINKRVIAAISSILLAVAFLFSACGDEFFDLYDEGYEAGFAAHKPLVIHFYVDDEMYHSITLSPDIETIFPADPVNEGLVFAGWYLDKDEWEKPFVFFGFPLAGISGTIEVFARFESPTGVIINQIYGLGNANNNGQAVSHSFVELYNTNDFYVSLDGFSVQASEPGINWKKLDLSGGIPAKHSFLIVLTRYSSQYSEEYPQSPRLQISEYDMAWPDAFFPSKNLKVVLLRSADLLTVANPFDYTGHSGRVAGYVDMIGAGGNDNNSDGNIQSFIDGCETDYLAEGSDAFAENKRGISKQRSIRRIDFADTDNNALDCETLDFRVADLKYRPRSTAFGAWESVDDEGMFFDALDFPSLHIGTPGAAAIESKEEYIPAAVSLRNTLEEFTFENTNAKIRGRGNFTWYVLDKKSYRLKFSKARSMLDSENSARDWVLLACHHDKSFFRDYSAFYLASLLDGMYFSPNAWFVDVYLNGAYQGVYLLCDQIQQNDGRVEVTYDADPEKCEYLLEWDGYAPDEGVEDADWVRIGDRPFSEDEKGIPVSIKFPSGSDLTAAHIAYVKQYLTAVDDAIMSAEKNYAAIENLIHEASFVDFFLVQEFFKNPDVAWSSFFLQIKGQDAQRRLQAEPVWDFHLAAGNFSEYDYKPENVSEENPWLKSLMEIPRFREAVIMRWSELSNYQIDATIRQIQQMAVALQAAFERNFLRWDIWSESVVHSPEVVAIDTFMGQVEYLINFFEARRAWLNDYYSSA